MKNRFQIVSALQTRDNILTVADDYEADIVSIIIMQKPH